ncbi:MAG: PTPA-CTERM sorting domain-containing protein [Alkalinema sp. RL_2_19]|nr:PTPA-CTERM sorting domain-containing protein [Alkalinema sp. RL_2_19]
MNFLKNIAKASVLGLVMAGGLSLAQVDRANALGLTFKPTGTSLDGDAAKDIVTSVGSVINFDLFLNTGGVADDDKVSELLYSIEWDTAELSFKSFAPQLTTAFVNIGFGLGSADFGQVLSPISPSDTSVKIASLAFDVLGGLNNDGDTDFMLYSLAHSTRMVKISRTCLRSGSQEVEVQPVPTPALIPGIAAMGMGLLRKRKKSETAEA